MKARIRLQPRSLAAVAWFLVPSITGACGAQPPAGPVLTTGPVQTSRPTLSEPDVTDPPAVAGGSWTGTITLHGVINKDETKDISSGDPGSTYYETGTSHDTTQTDVTDTFNITANDPEDVTYGIDSVDFAGAAANTGTTLERYIQNWNKQNSGCTWKEELGDQTSGNWNGAGTANGSLRLNEDGSYSIDVSAGASDANGEYQTPELPHRTWLTVSDVSAGCTGDTTYDTTDTQGPIVWWVSSLIGETDVNNLYSDIHGQIIGAPGTTIDGSISWNLQLPAVKMDITWHLVHSGPIVLPHS